MAARASHCVHAEQAHSARSCAQESAQKVQSLKFPEYARRERLVCKACAENDRTTKRHEAWTRTVRQPSEERRTQGDAEREKGLANRNTRTRPMKFRLERLGDGPQHIGRHRAAADEHPGEGRRDDRPVAAQLA